jgi:hypothetical protein
MKNQKLNKTRQLRPDNFRQSAGVNHGEQVARIMLAQDASDSMGVFSRIKDIAVNLPNGRLADVGNLPRHARFGGNVSPDQKSWCVVVHF